MTIKVLPVSERGQITIPAKSRRKLRSGYVSFEESDGVITLRSLETREDFIAELDAIEKDWEKNGGIEFEATMKKSHQRS